MQALRVARTAARLTGAAHARAASVQATALSYTRFGAVDTVVSAENRTLDDNVKDNEVFIKMLAAPITSSDVSAISGWAQASGVAPPAVAGIEGVGQVVKAGAKSGLAAGDWVVPAKPYLGTWATHAVAGAADVVKVPAATGEGGVEQMAASVFPRVVAQALLKSGPVPLAAGDVVIQNGAAGAVGQALMQVAAEAGIVVINVAREHDDWDQLVNHWHSLNNASISATEELTQTPAWKRLLADVPAPKLAIDMVGGKSGLTLAQTLTPGGTLVSIGNVSKHPLPLTADVLLRKGITVTGWSLENWAASAGPEAVKASIEEAGKAVAAGKARTLVAWEPFADWKLAVSRAQKRGERKIVLKMDQ